MTDDHEGAKTTFVEQLWGLPEEVLIQRFITAKQAGDQETSLAILQAKALRAAQQTSATNQVLADETARLARQTTYLARMTGVLAVATVAMAVTAVAGG